MYKQFRCLWLCLCAAILLAGCDGSVNFSINGAINGATAGDIFRGLAFKGETIDEDPAKSNKRRDLYEFIATRAGVNVSAKFMQALTSNPHYSNVTIDGKALTPGDETLDAVWVKFDVDHQTNVSLNFLQGDKRLFGPLRVNRLPLLDSITMTANGAPITSNEGVEVLLTRILNSDKDSFANHIKQLSLAMKAHQADVEERCRKALPNTDDFEVDPGRSPPDKERAYQAFEQRQHDLVQTCIRQRMGQSTH